MYYSDYVANHIYSATLDTGGDVELLLNDSVEVPGMSVVHGVLCDHARSTVYDCPLALTENSITLKLH